MGTHPSKARPRPGCAGPGGGWGVGIRGAVRCGRRPRGALQGPPLKPERGRARSEGTGQLSVAAVAALACPPGSSVPAAPDPGTPLPPTWRGGLAPGPCDPSARPAPAPDPRPAPERAPGARAAAGARAAWGNFSPSTVRLGPGAGGGRAAGGRAPATHSPFPLPRPPSGAPQPPQPSSGERALKVSGPGGAATRPGPRARRAFCPGALGLGVWGGLCRGIAGSAKAPTLPHPPAPGSPAGALRPRPSGNGEWGGPAERRGIFKAQRPRGSPRISFPPRCPVPALPPAGPQGTASWCLRTRVAAKAPWRRSGAAAWSTARGTSR